MLTKGTTMNIAKLMTTFVTLNISLMAFADNNSCQFNLNCENGGKQFTIEFKSKSNDCSADDAEGNFKYGKLTKKLDIKPDWYVFTDHVSKTQVSICHNDKNIPFTAYSITPDKALLFVKSSGRPGYDKVNAILLNTLYGDVLDKKVLGSTKNNFVAVLRSKNGLKLRLIRDSLSFNRLVTCDCDAPFVDDWMQVDVKGEKIQSAWMTK